MSSCFDEVGAGRRNAHSRRETGTIISIVSETPRWSLAGASVPGMLYFVHRPLEHREPTVQPPHPARKERD